MGSNDFQHRDYRQYQESVDAFLADFEGEPSSGYWHGECPYCDGANTADADHDCEQEAHFSYTPCDCCNRPLGGDRMDMIGWLKGARGNGYSDNYKWSGAVCCDCEYYFAYGRLDDMTMLEIEQ